MFERKSAYANVHVAGEVHREGGRERERERDRQTEIERDNEWGMGRGVGSKGTQDLKLPLC